MNSSKIMKFATAGLGLALILGGCGSSSNNPPEGSGGNTQGSGGTTSSSGGSTGSGGHTSSGGTTGSGGETGSGGKVGSGGTSSSGGTTGSGGTSSSGGTTGSGGATTSSGGASAGGATGSGGSAGGSVGSGGKAGGSGSGSGGKAGGSGSGSGGTAGGSGSGSMTLTSPTLTDGAHMDSKYTCQESPALMGKMVGGLGNGINPELDWTGVPAGTMSFAITFLDTTLINAGMDSYGDHWAMWNIPATVMKLPEMTMTLSGDFAMAKQSGTFLAPCAQSLMGGMDDQYAFTVYALSTASLTVSTTGMDVVKNARTALMTAMSAGQVLGTAVLKGHAGLKGM